MFDYRAETDAVTALKETFSRHASGVSVITIVDQEGKPAGLTATSMTSLGATPPLASFNVASGSSSWPALCTAEYVAIHTLGESNVSLAKKMSSDHTLRFVEDDWVAGPHGVPVFKDATSVLFAKIRQIVPVEKNAVVIVDVIDGLVGHEQSGLLYYRRNYVAAGSPIAL
jgi:flavin reductase (DIM6/NTAB) family NADH-FMN oxidoreductase RutF